MGLERHCTAPGRWETRAKKGRQGPRLNRYAALGNKVARLDEALRNHGLGIAVVLRSRQRGSKPSSDRVGSSYIMSRRSTRFSQRASGLHAKCCQRSSRHSPGILNLPSPFPPSYAKITALTRLAYRDQKIRLPHQLHTAVAMSNETDSSLPSPDGDNPPPMDPAGPSVGVVRPSPAAIAVPIVIFFAVVLVLVGGYFALVRWSRRRAAIEERSRRVRAAKRQQMEHGRRQRARGAAEERQMKGLDEMELEEIETGVDTGRRREEEV